MMIEVGQHIKCFLRTSTMVEGIVQEIGEQLVLKSLDGESLLIIHQPKQDIVMTKVCLPDSSKPQTEQIADKIRQKQLEYEQTSDEPPSNEELRHMSVAELSIEKAKQERRIMTNKLREHLPTQGVKKVVYGQPGFYQKSRA